jgi:hypothetical protein
MLNCPCALAVFMRANEETAWRVAAAAHFQVRARFPRHAD